MKKIILGFLALIAPSISWATDPACTLTPNLSIYLCPQNSTDWYSSYTGIVNNLDSLSKTTPSTFTINGQALINGPVVLQSNSSITLSGSNGYITSSSSGNFSGLFAQESSIKELFATNTSTYSIVASSSIYTAKNVNVGGDVCTASKCLSAAGIGTGDVVAAGNNTFTGNNIFGSSTTFNGLLVNQWQVAESSNVTSSTGTFCFSTVIASTQSYRIEYSILAVSPMIIHFNLGNGSIDRGANYKWGGELCSDASCAGNNASGSTFGGIAYTATNMGTGDFANGVVEFMSANSTPKIILYQSRMSERYNAGANFNSWVGGGMYTGSSAANMACIDSSVSNSFTGSFILYTKNHGSNGI